MLDKIKSLFKKKDNPTVLRRIVGIKGELTPGVITVDIENFMPDGITPQDVPTETLHVKITPKMRAVCNRILAGQETENDIELFNMFVLE